MTDLETMLRRNLSEAAGAVGGTGLEAAAVERRLGQRAERRRRRALGGVLVGAFAVLVVGSAVALSASHPTGGVQFFV